MNATEARHYPVLAMEFDPIFTFDNCDIVGFWNDFNLAATLDGAQIPEGTTTVTWSITDGAGNTSACSFEITVNDFVSGTENLPATGISVYPNPTNGLLFLAVSESNIQSVMLFDISGKKLFETALGSFYSTIDVSFLQNGIYVLILNTGSEVLPIRILKM